MPTANGVERKIYLSNEDSEMRQRGQAFQELHSVEDEMRRAIGPAPAQI